MSFTNSFSLAEYKRGWMLINVDYKMYPFKDYSHLLKNYKHCKYIIHRIYGLLILCQCLTCSLLFRDLLRSRWIWNSLTVRSVCLLLSMRSELPLFSITLWGIASSEHKAANQWWYNNPCINNHSQVCWKYTTLSHQDCKPQA